MLIDPDHFHAVEPVRVLDEHPAAFGQDRVVGGVPRHREGLGDAGDGQVRAHEPFQRPPQRAARQPRSRLGRLRRVLPPHVTTARAPVAAHRHQQSRGSPPERLVCQLPGHAVPRRSFTAAPATPTVVLDYAAGQHRAFRFQALPDHDQAELVEAAERGQAGAREGSSVKHVEVLRVAGVGTSILGRPRPLPRHRRAGHYTLKSEEPLNPEAATDRIRYGGPDFGNARYGGERDVLCLSAGVGLADSSSGSRLSAVGDLSDHGAFVWMGQSLRSGSSPRPSGRTPTPSCGKPDTARR